jgi:hypothetical protein
MRPRKRDLPSVGAERAETADEVAATAGEVTACVGGVTGVTAGARIADTAFTPMTDAKVLAPTDAAPFTTPFAMGGSGGSLKPDSLKSPLASWRAKTRSREVGKVPLVQ